MNNDYELSVVIPVYNEEKIILSVIQDWEAVFSNNNIRHQYLIIDDGSTDKSFALLQAANKKNADIKIFTHPNEGHGPSILKAYKMALDTEWIFQVDSDHQLDTTAFITLWKNRENYDFLLGERQDKNATITRKFLSSFSRFLVQLLYGNKIHDVNSPYRLMRTAKLKEALNRMAEKTFAPNVLLTAYFILKKTRIFTTSVQQRNDKLSKKSKMNMYFLKGCFNSLFQTILFRFKL
jgi:dolichol-phosphate mannosyltransferase